jgi:hypothetical protein
VGDQLLPGFARAEHHRDRVADEVDRRLEAGDQQQLAGGQ